MKKQFKKLAIALVLSGSLSMASADTNTNVCTYDPGNVNCGSGTVESLQGAGTVIMNGTTVTGMTVVNGLLNADDANFNSLEVNGSVKLSQCTVNDMTDIKGSLTASSTNFKKSLKIYSEKTRFINSKIIGDLRIYHTETKKQVVYLDNYSEVTGNIIFDDGAGEVIMRGKSKISGKVVGGQIITN